MERGHSQTRVASALAVSAAEIAPPDHDLFDLTPPIAILALVPWWPGATAASCGGGDPTVRHIADCWNSRGRDARPRRDVVGVVCRDALRRWNSRDEGVPNLPTQRIEGLDER